MFYATKGVLDLHAAEVASIPALATTTAEFYANVLSIQQLLSLQVKDLRGYTQEKREARELMEMKTLEVGGRAMAWATATGQDGLAAEFNVTANSLGIHRDSVVASRCQALATLANTHAAALVPFGVDAADLTELQTLIDAYTVLVQLPRTLTTVRKQVTGELGLLVRDTMRLLTNRMDMLIRGFEVSNAVFHARYTAAREIIDLGGRGTVVVAA